MTRKIVLILGVLIVLAAAAGVWYYAAATSPENVRLELEELTGARVRLERVERLWFPPGVRLRGVRIDAQGYRLAGDELEVRIALLPLLRGRVEPQRINLSDARLALAASEASGPALPSLPLGASWTIRRLDIFAPVNGEEKRIFYVSTAGLETLLGLERRLSLTGGPSPQQPDSLNLTGRITDTPAGTLPEGEFLLSLKEFPAQPAVGWLAGDRELLAPATVDADLRVESHENTAAFRGSFGAAAEGVELLAGSVRLRATYEELTLESASGHVANNQFSARGRIRRWLEENREAEFEVSVPEGRLEDDTLDVLRLAYGRPALGFAEDIRGQFGAELEVVSGPERQALTGTVELKGMRLTDPDLPPVNDIRGRLLLENRRVRMREVTAQLWGSQARLAGEMRGRRLDLELETDPIPLARLPLPAEKKLPVSNLTGAIEIKVDIRGDVRGPTITGEARLGGGGFDFRQVEVRDVEAEARFAPPEVRVESARGRAGKCSFTASGELRLPRWQETLAARAEAPECALADLLQLAEQVGFGGVRGLDPATLEGTGTVSARFEEGAWRADVEVEGARWQAPALDRSVEDIRLRLAMDSSAIRLRRLSGRLGSSEFFLRGRVRLDEGEVAGWELALETDLSVQDAEQLLPVSARDWVKVPMPLEGRAELTGSPAEGSRVVARLLGPEPAPTGSNGAGSANPAAAVRRGLALRGAWQDPIFRVEEFTATFGATRLSAEGEIRWEDEAKEADLRLRAPAGSSLSELLAFVRVPERFQGSDGQVAADLRLRGSVDDPSWSGTVDLEEVRVPNLLTEPVRLSGRLGVEPKALRLHEIEVAQPQGRFTLEGTLRAGGVSELELRGAWANLDRLLGQVPDEAMTPAQKEFIARYPLEANLQVDKVRFMNAVFSDVRGRLQQREGVFRLRVPAFGIGQGTGELQMDLDPVSNRIHTTLALRQVQTEALLVEVLRMAPTVRAPLDLRAELNGPRGSQEEFLRGASGRVDFNLGEGKIQRGTLPERLFALGAMLHEGFYGFGILRLARLTNPPNLRNFHDWTGVIEIDEGKALARSPIIAENYDLNLTGEVDFATEDFRLHGEGNFHPGWQFDISIKSLVDGLGRLFNIARGKRGLNFEFDVSGKLGGRKSVENFRFKD